MTVHVHTLEGMKGKHDANAAAETAARKKRFDRVRLLNEELDHLLGVLPSQVS